MSAVIRGDLVPVTVPQTVLEEATATLAALRQVDPDEDGAIEWSPHAITQVLDRPGLHHDYVEDVVARPYGEVYRQRGSDRLILYDPDRDTPTGKPRAVVVAIDRGTAVIVTAYNVDERRQRQFDAEDGYEWIGSLCTAEE